MKQAMERLGLLTSVALGAGWASYAGTLAAELPPARGPVAVGAAWAGLMLALTLAYRAALPEQPATPRTPRRIAAALLLALVSTHGVRLLAAAFIDPATWDHLFYLKRLVPPALVAGWCAVLLPRETWTLARVAGGSRTLAPLPHLAVLLFAAAALVSWADLAFEWSGASATGSTLKSEIIYQEAWTANVLILFSAYALVLALTSKVWTSLLLVTPGYLLLAMATVIKIRYMQSAVQPVDLVRIPELLPFLRSFAGSGIVAATVAGGGLWIGALVLARRTRPSPISAGRRWVTGLLSLAVLLAFPVAYFRSTTIPDDVEASLPPADVLLSRFRVRGREHKEMARLRGVLVAFISGMPAAFATAPPGYSPAAVAGTLRKYCSSAAPAPRRGRTNLILYLVESFMDPTDLGLHFTADPIPNIRALRKAQVGGYAIVPEEFGGSANTEFEALTAMAMTFLPEGSSAYRVYLRQPVPSLPSALGELGYVTTAVQPDPKHFFDRERAYRLLGFDHVVWLGDAPDVERDPRGWWPTDRAVVKAVIEATRGPKPVFVFAFPSATHFPFNSGTYGRTDLDVLDVPSPDAKAEVKEYINSLRVADRAIGSLVEHFRDQPDSTIIAVLGDHLPPLPEGAMRTFLSRESGKTKPERSRMRRRVPLLVWANFTLPHEERELSVHALPSYLLETMGIAPQGLLGVSDAVRRRIPVLASYAQGSDGRLWQLDSLPDEERGLVEDYRLLQYDLLLGRQYSLRGHAGSDSPCRGATLEVSRRGS
jgi:Sulfatase